MEKKLNEIASRRGIGFLPLLALMFIGLKLSGLITWSWWWVLAPLWGPVALVILMFAFILLVAILKVRKEMKGKAL